MYKKSVWVGIALFMTLWVLGACAEDPQGRVSAPLIGGDQGVVQSGSIPQQLVVILVTPTPVQGAASGSGNQQVAQAPSDGGGDGSESGGSGNSGGESSGDSAAQGQQVGDQQLIDQGSEIYANNCAMCHGPDGQGSGSFPALAGSAIATSEDPSAAITTVLQGRGQMPGFGDQLNDEQVASVVSYVRNSFGNSAAVVQPDEVAQVSGGQGGGQQAQQQQTQQQPEQQPEQQQAQQQQQPEQQQTQQQQPEQQAEQQQAQQQQPEQQQQDGSQQQASQPPQQQGASTTVSTQNGQITLQIQIMLMTPEPSGASQGQSAQPAATPMPEATGEVTDTATMTDTGTTSTGTTSTSQQPPSETNGAQGGEQSGEQSSGQSGEQSREQSSEQSAAQDQQQADGNQEAGAEQLASQGQEVYANNCAICHGPEGEGSGSYPPLAGSPVLTSQEPNEPIMIVLEGRGQMPAFSGQLSNEEIAAVLTYARGAWDNGASPVQPQQVEDAAGGGQAQQTDQQQPEQQQTQQQQTQQQQPEQQQAQPSQQSGQQPVQSTQQEQVIPIEIRIVIDASGNVQVESVGGETQAASGEQGAAPPATDTGAQTDTGTQAEAGTTQEDTGAQAGTGTGTETGTGAEAGTETNAATGTEQPQSASGTGSDPDTDNDPAEVQSAGSGEGGSEESSQAAADSQVSMAEGAQLYMQNCAACHQVGGEGVEGAYPPLAGNPFVTAQDPQPVIQVVIRGRAGMPSFGPYLAADELAAIISYIRGSWGNSASPVPLDQVEQRMEVFQREEGGEGH